MTTHQHIITEREYTFASSIADLEADQNHSSDDVKDWTDLSISDCIMLAKDRIAWRSFVLSSLVFNLQQKILLNCDHQSNVLLARNIFFCILLKAFSFLSACIKNPASN